MQPTMAPLQAPVPQEPPAGPRPERELFAAGKGAPNWRAVANLVAVSLVGQSPLQAEVFLRNFAFASRESGRWSADYLAAAEVIAGARGEKDITAAFELRRLRTSDLQAPAAPDNLLHPPADPEAYHGADDVSFHPPAEPPATLTTGPVTGEVRL